MSDKAQAITSMTETEHSEHDNNTQQTWAKQQLHDVLTQKRIIVCCGAGGVGKTTTSAALGLAATLLGRRVLVLTIDPARRLADALGTSLTQDTPQEVDIRTHINITKYSSIGRFDLWMVQPQPVFDRMIQTLARDEEHARQIFSTRIYQAVRRLVAGMQEYMAGESLYQYVQQRNYDLIVLDTPPSRNAIDFLNAPEQLLRFLDARVLRAFAPPEKSSFWLNRARKLINATFEQVAGLRFLVDTQEFVGLMFDIFDTLQEHARVVREMLASEQSTHLLVTSPDVLAQQEALYFQHMLTQRKIPFAGFLLNRSLAMLPTTFFQELNASEKAALGISSPTLEAAFQKMLPLAEQEVTLVSKHQEIYRKLKQKTSAPSFAFATPHLGEDIEDLSGLLRLAHVFL
ncbi:MAG: ArsA-related P-loop ATPase [Myxococcota bacterium]